MFVSNGPKQQFPRVSQRHVALRVPPQHPSEFLHAGFVLKVNQAGRGPAGLFHLLDAEVRVRPSGDLRQVRDREYLV
jgi:hypothetical protein